MGADEALFEYVTSANVACGFHAGDPSVIDRTVARAVRAGVAVGAHPGHFDLRGFGRREMRRPASEVEADVVYQVGALPAFARAHGAPLSHVKPHGALYNQAADDRSSPRPSRAAWRASRRELVLVGLAGSQSMRQAAAAAGLRFAAEAFVDRAYDGVGAARAALAAGSGHERPGGRGGGGGPPRPRPESSSRSTAARSRSRRTRCACTATTRTRSDVARAVREALEGAGVSVQALAR